MTRVLSAKVPAVAGELAVAAALLAWRVRIHPWSDLWRDWFAILCAYWIWTALGSRPKAGLAASILVMGALLAIYIASQGPSTLALLGLGP